MHALWFALISFLGWGVGDIPGAIASRKLGAYSVIFWSILTSLILCSLYIPFSISQLHNISMDLILIILMLTFVFYFGDIMFCEALIVGNPSIVGTVAASFSAVVAVFSIIFLKETISLSQCIGIAIIFTGVILSSLDFNQLKQGKIFKDKGVFFAVIVMFCWGIYFTFVKIPVKQIGWFWPNYIVFACVPLFYLYIKLKKIKLQKPNYKNAFVPVMLSALLLRTAEFTYNVAIDKGLSAIVAPIAGSYPILFAPLAYFFFKDKVTKQQIAGAVTTIIGIIFLSFISS